MGDRSRPPTWLSIASKLGISLLCVGVAGYSISMGQGTGVDTNNRRSIGPRVYEPGDVLDLPGHTFSGTGDTLALILRSGCHYCSENAPFYRALSKRFSPTALQIVAVSTEPTRILADYLERQAIPTASIIQVRWIRLSGVPTVIWTDRRGVIRQLWRGKLDASEQQEVLSALENALTSQGRKAEYD